MTTRRRLFGTIATRSARSRSSLYEPGARRTWCSVDRSRRQRCAVGRLPARDATNGFWLFGRRVLDEIVIESDRGFCYSIELVVKCHRLHWSIGEAPAQWRERARGTSRFQLIKWLPAYLRWYFYAFATTYLRRSARTVPLKSAGTNHRAS